MTEGGCLIAIAHCDRLGVQAAQQRAVLRQKLDMPALGALEYYIATRRSVWQKRELGEHVAIEFVVTAQALYASGAAHWLFLD